MNDFLSILQWASPAVAGIAGWFGGRYGRRTDSLQKMQETIDQLVQKNQELYKEVLALRQDNIELKAGQRELKEENAELRKQLTSRKL